ncbi:MULTISPECIES: response regulator transcription factor [Dehalococcoides]|jgi:two-component system OmpR family response regulator|uniref:DNA-binding response regulator, two-component system, OmpR family n=2 Tax=Dehalococcoides mccartyi TaxID=61435 RepID=A0A142V7Y9_9CHLR|nr:MULTISPECIES: response regulator transcription factor [Dehalococcoides]AGG05791.1 phosphate regulon transcriptional regulatory protein PhoB (SphR) [Dehalococcoides mccartyi DCMB5]AMU85930.1 DNA-binding response regulator, two-component system, OmpR family [Dehalococcoides mccartyi]AOV98804.1 phosphate regulon transcriptional regulatory protein [Dehalococcoides mccartyi]AQX72676.1 DNA-binding response regulator [Dehalococcoides mccartyi]AQX74079.1 DNA-binding response regulator [Dehalococcoi
MPEHKILVVEDDATLRELLCYNLAKEGYQLECAEDGLKALSVYRLFKPALVILDVMIPGIDGFELCRLIRAESSVPILMLTARSSEADKVNGLEAGADDYLSKPFGMKELLARMKALLRRSQMQNSPAEPAGGLKIGDLEIFIERHLVIRNGVALDFSPKEFDLFSFLVQNRYRVFSREQLLEKVWGYDYPGGTRTVDVHISWLRQKIEADPSKPRHLITVRGTGYKFEE